MNLYCNTIGVPEIYWWQTMNFDKRKCFVHLVTTKKAKKLCKFQFITNNTVINFVYEAGNLDSFNRATKRMYDKIEKLLPEMDCFDMACNLYRDVPFNLSRLSEYKEHF